MGYGQNCALCCKNMADGEIAYGITRGCIDGDQEGFRMDMDDEWDVWCPDCMNVIVRLVVDYRNRMP